MIRSLIGVTNSPLLIVFVAKPAGMTYGDGMNTLRMWLDARKIHPSAFKLHTNGQVGFQISWRLPITALWKRSRPGVRRSR
jgi:hypothetical protein